jgi:fumarate reductase subunit D
MIDLIISAFTAGVAIAALIAPVALLVFIIIWLIDRIC